MKDRLALLASALWWGSLTTVGFLVVPLLFAHLGSPAQAGQMAARLFTAQTWLSVACVVVLIVHLRATTEPSFNGPGQTDFLLMTGGLLLALLVEFGVAPRIVARQDLKLWHAVGTGMYFAQWVCAGALLWRRAGRR